MPRFYFNIYDGHHIADRVGTDCINVPEARAEAVRRTALLLGNQAHRVSNGQDWWMEVTDATGLPLFCLHFTITDVFGRNPPLESRRPDAGHAHGKR